MAEYLRRSRCVHSDAGEFRGQYPAELTETTVYVTVCLHSSTQRRDWWHALNVAFAGLRYRQTDTLGDLATFSVQGPSVVLDKLIRRKCVRSVQYRMATVYGEQQLAAAGQHKPPMPAEVRAKLNSERRRQANAAAKGPIPPVDNPTRSLGIPAPSAKFHDDYNRRVVQQPFEVLPLPGEDR
jgi:hypothetical protein